GQLRLDSSNYSASADLNRVIKNIPQDQDLPSTPQEKAQETFLNFLLYDEHNFGIKKVALRLAVASYEKQVQTFMLAATHKNFSKSPLKTDLSSPEKIITKAQKQASLLSQQIKKLERNPPIQPPVMQSSLF